MFEIYSPRIYVKSKIIFYSLKIIKNHIVLRNQFESTNYIHRKSVYRKSRRLRRNLRARKKNHHFGIILYSDVKVYFSHITIWYLRIGEETRARVVPYAHIEINKKIYTKIQICTVEFSRIVSIFTAK